MATHYYIHTDTTKDGPHDLVTVMRRIRAGKISADTGISIDQSETPVPASELPDTAMFFSRADIAEPAAAPIAVNLPALRFSRLLKDGWRFTAENSITTVFAGGMLLMVIMLAAGMVSALQPLPGGMLSWVVFMMCYYIFSIACLRLYRGQPFSAAFLNENFFPVLSPLLFAALVIGLMLVGGMLLFVLPGLLVAVYYAFVPFFILDRHMSLVEAMHASRLLILKHRGRYQWQMLALVSMFALSLLLIVPIPVIMPLYTAALCKMYEELSAS